MHKITIYISSRSKTQSSGLDNNITLSDLRIKLREELEKETFLGEEIIEVIIHENNFDPDATKDAHELSLSKLDECHIVILLYNGDSGWNAASTGNGICHDEFLTAIDSFSQMMHIINVSDVFPMDDRKIKEKDEAFQDAVKNSNIPWAELINASTVEGLYNTVINQIKNLVVSDLEKAFATQKYHVKRSPPFGESLQFAQMTYIERASKISDSLKKTVPALFPDTILNIAVVPDNMSLADARAFIGRPFLDELKIIVSKQENKGVIHIIGVYGTVTELQVKNLVGFPDLAVNKTSFGFYLWDTTNHIQMFFLQKCTNTDAVGLNINYLEQWLKTSGERERIAKRAEARFKILITIKSCKL